MARASAGERRGRAVVEPGDQQQAHADQIGRRRQATPEARARRGGKRRVRCLGKHRDMRRARRIEAVEAAAKRRSAAGQRDRQPGDVECQGVHHSAATRPPAWARAAGSTSPSFDKSRLAKGCGSHKSYLP